MRSERTISLSLVVMRNDLPCFCWRQRRARVLLAEGVSKVYFAVAICKGVLWGWGRRCECDWKEEQQ